MADFEIIVYSTPVHKSSTWRDVHANGGGPKPTRQVIARPNTTRDAVDKEASAMLRLRQKRGYLVRVAVAEVGNAPIVAHRIAMTPAVGVGPTTIVLCNVCILAYQGAPDRVEPLTAAQLATVRAADGSPIQECSVCTGALRAAPADEPTEAQA